MAASIKRLRCARCVTVKLRMPGWHDDTPIICAGCGETLGTIGQLPKLLVAALAEDPHIDADNDNVSEARA